MSYYTDVRFPIIDAKEEKGRLWRVWNRYFKDVNGKILDAGCSVGNFISLSPEIIIGIDIDRDAIEVCRRRGLNAMYMDLDRKLGFKDNSFDAIYSNHSLEHTQDPMFTMREFYRILKPSGKLVLFVPNVLRYKFEIFNEYTHKHFFTPRSLEEVTYNAGFRDFRIYQEHRSIMGLGWLARRGLVNVNTILYIQEILKVFKITSKDMVLEAIK